MPLFSTGICKVQLRESVFSQSIDERFTRMGPRQPMSTVKNADTPGCVNLPGFSLVQLFSIWMASRSTWSQAGTGRCTRGELHQGWGNLDSKSQGHHWFSACLEMHLALLNPLFTAFKNEGRGRQLGPRGPTQTWRSDSSCPKYPKNAYPHQCRRAKRH